MANLASRNKRKAMEQDVDTDDLEERAMMQQPRTKFSVMEAGGDEGDTIDDEVPGSVRADRAVATPRDMLAPQQQPGDLNQITTHTHPQMADPALAAGKRSQHRTEAKQPGGAAPNIIPMGAEEGMQDSREQFNETGVPIEPFNLDREREEGQFDAGGGYIPNNFPQVKDAWLDSIDDAGGVQGTDGDMSVDHPNAHPANDEELQAAPPELPSAELQQYRQTVLELLQVEETIPAALRRLSESNKQQPTSKAQAEPTLEDNLRKQLGKFGQDAGVHPAANKPKKSQQHQDQPPQPVPKHNRQAMDRLTEAAEVLLDHGHTDIYNWSRSQVQQHLAHLDATAQQRPAKRSRIEAQASEPQTVDPQSFQASTAGELTYGKDKARDMLKLKRSGGNDQVGTGLAHPQDVSGGSSAVRKAAQSVDSATQPSQAQQVQVDAQPAAQHKPQGSAKPAPFINPVGASSNYSNQNLTPIDKTSPHGQLGTVAAPSSSQTATHAVSDSSVDLARPGDAATAADKPAAGSNTSKLDKPGLSDPQDNQLPGYQAEALGRAHGQKAGARDQNKPRDHLGIPAEPGQGSAKGPAAGSAERPTHAVGATDIPHGKAVEPSYNQNPQPTGKADPSFKQAAAAFATSPTEAAQRK